MKDFNSLAWEEHFPPVYGHTSIAFLKQCPSFYEAKNGDMKAALNVVKRCINFHTIFEIREKYPDAVLLPVITDNKLPEALAIIIGMKMHTEVRVRYPTNRKSLSAMGRLLHKPVFAGKIIKGARYIIVDDIITQGGTVAELRKYVINHGGRVAAIVTLSYSIGSKILVPEQKDIYSLINKFSQYTITETLRTYNIAYDLRELTRAQIKYLLHFKAMDEIISKIKQAQQVESLFCGTAKPNGFEK